MKLCSSLYVQGLSKVELVQWDAGGSLGLLWEMICCCSFYMWQSFPCTGVQLSHEKTGQNQLLYETYGSPLGLVHWLAVQKPVILYQLWPNFYRLEQEQKRSGAPHPSTLVFPTSS